MSHIEIFDSRYARLKAVDWDFTDASQDSLASIHPYPARFIPDIPRELISGLGCDKGAVILDPFCGSGTTLLEAQRAGFESVGIDLNPIACLISSIVTFARKRQNSAHRPEFGRWALRYMFRYSSITSNIIRAPSLKPF